YHAAPPMRTPRRLATLPRVRLAPASFPLMLPTLVEEVPRGPGWLFELKWDGVRVLALRAGGQVELWARSGARVTDRYPEGAAARPSWTPPARPAWRGWSRSGGTRATSPAAAPSGARSSASSARSS